MGPSGSTASLEEDRNPVALTGRLSTRPLGDGETPRQGRLLSTFILLVLAVCGAADLISNLSRPGSLIPPYVYGFLIVGLVLNRVGRYGAAAAVTLAMFPAVTFMSVLSGSDPSLTFPFLVIGTIAASLLLDRRSAVLFDLACFTFLVLTPWLMPEQVPGWRTILAAAILLAIGSGLSIILVIHREEVERDRQGALRASEERLRLALDAARMGTWEWDNTVGGVRWSDRAEALLGLDAETLGRAPGAYFQRVHQDDREMVERTFSDAVTGRIPDFELLHRVVRPDAAARWVQIQGRSSGGDADNRRLNGTIVDVTDRKNGEAEREALIRELEEKNAELERFTYTVSHDLKSPLITVRGFLGSIEKDVKDGRVDRLSVDVERILSATARMQKLLEELLNLSRIGRVANPPERVAFTELAREAMALVRGRLDAAHVRVEIRDDLPEVFGDRSRLVQVLQNLLDNAAKFMGEQKNPRIVVGSRPSSSDGRPVFFVQDNGVGIEAAHLQKVLGLFEKLDERGEGTGVGLAIVKRIVEVHGGKLWLESAGRGLGTTVCFTLPTRPPV